MHAVGTTARRAGLDWLDDDYVAYLRAGLPGRPGRQLERPPRTPYHRRNPPRPQLMADADHPAQPIEEYDVDWKSHEEHMHPHEGLEPSRLEQHPAIRRETLTAKQPAALARDSTRRLEACA